MPVEQKIKKRGEKKHKKAMLKKLFDRYNKEKITTQGVVEFITAIFYRLGYAAELEMLLMFSSMKNFYYIFKKYVRHIFKLVKRFLYRMFDTLFEDIGRPLGRLKRSLTTVVEIVKGAKGEDDINAGHAVKEYVVQGVKKHKRLLPTLVRYIIPLATFGVMVYVIYNGMNKGYGIEISLDGEAVGVVNNYKILQNADNVIKGKLVTLNDEQKWSINPTVKIVSTQNDTVLDERQLADSILKASDQNIMTATGLYVDGVFYGAVEKPQGVQAALDGLLAPYFSEDPNKSVSFIQNVYMLEGIYFTDTIVDEAQLINMVGGQVEGERKYTVVQGDSPSLIAKKNEIRLKELYALNPELEGGGLWPGDELLVGQAVPFLQVQELIRQTYEVEVKYKTTIKPNNTMNMGTSKTSQSGENGINQITSDVLYIDGIYQSETVIETLVIKEPVEEIIEQGRLFNGGVFSGGSGKLIWPTGSGVRVSRGFAGQYPAHNGIDIAGPAGTAIYAADSGVVTKAVYTYSGYGVHLIINHGNGTETLYAHCSSLNVSYGQKVSKGEIVARMGSTGNSTGNHLHFEVKSGNTRYDPQRFF